MPGGLGDPLTSAGPGVPLAHRLPPTPAPETEGGDAEAVLDGG
ncbi:hypothetical protein ACF1BK_27885 [Streptomyces globisporus]